MSLKENTSYQSSFQPFLQGLANASAKLKNTKTVSTAPLRGVATAVKSGVNKTRNVGSSLGAVTTPYGGSTRYEKFHPGIDIANKIGTPIATRASGTVVEEVLGKKQGDKGFGNYIIVQDAAGNKHRYSHLAGGFVKVGQKVNKGQRIGAMGNSGQTYSTSGGTGSHLDYRIVDMYGRYINPLTYKVT